MKVLVLSLTLLASGSAVASAPAPAALQGTAGYAAASALMLAPAVAQCTPEQVNAATNACISQRCGSYAMGSYNFHTCVSQCAAEASRNCG